MRKKKYRVGDWRHSTVAPSRQEGFETNSCMGTAQTPDTWTSHDFIVLRLIFTSPNDKWAHTWRSHYKSPTICRLPLVTIAGVQVRGRVIPLSSNAHSPARLVIIVFIYIIPLSSDGRYTASSNYLRPPLPSLYLPSVYFESVRKKFRFGYPGLPLEPGQPFRFFRLFPACTNSPIAVQPHQGLKVVWIC